MDANKTARLVAIFDRAMSDAGWSFCGGGPAFPKMKGRPRWVSPEKIDVEVELEPDHEYRLSLNCGSAKNFRSAGGTPLAPVAWSFSTLPAKLPDATKQKAANRQALSVLQKVLAASYSYYDLRVRDWAKLVKQHEAAIVGAKNGFGPILERSVTGNQVAARRFLGPIVVLTSRYVMSSNESFVLMMKQANDCTVVGQRTFGSSGNPKLHDLGNGVSVVLPSWQDLRLDGTCFEGEGLAPDIEVAVDPAELEQRDPILERALALLREKLK